MSDLDDACDRAAAWLQPLEGEQGPCGPDLEYDNDFLALSQAVAGKPESQFGPAEPPEWPRAVEIAEALLERTRDLRVAIEWMRGLLHLHGYGALGAGLQVLNGLIDAHWDHLHPLPDPDDGDPYGRVNALTLLREPAGLLGDLRDAVIVNDRATGLLLVRDIESALGLAPVMPGRPELGKGQVAQIMGAALARQPELRTHCSVALDQLRLLMAAATERLGGEAPDLRPLYGLVKAVGDLLPKEDGGSPSAGGMAASADADDAGNLPAGVGQGLSGQVTSRDEALYAIDLVIDFLERTEPTNPAPLFLRRARQLVGQNFLQLLKTLAPDALPGVARVVGVDPDSVTDPESGY